MDRQKLMWALLLALSGAIALAQQPRANDPQGPPPPPGQGPQGGPQGMLRPGPPSGRGVAVGQQRPPEPGPPPIEQVLLPGPRGKWWDDPELAQRLTLTADQRKRMDDVFQQSRLKLIDLHAAVQKEEAIMEPLVSAEQPDENKIVAQIDKVAQARAELEKANARMLLAIRRILTPEQLQKLGPRRPGQPPPPPARKK